MLGFVLGKAGSDSFHGCVFSFSGETAADMPLRFVCGENVFYITVKTTVNMFQPLAYVLMYRTLRNAELLRGEPHGRFVLNDILTELGGSVINYIHVNTP